MFRASRRIFSSTPERRDFYLLLAKLHQSFTAKVVSYLSVLLRFFSLLGYLVHRCLS